MARKKKGLRQTTVPRQVSGPGPVTMSSRGKLSVRKGRR